jgi:leader peptidase (prepilin peptidase)/N-methyltransferase
VDSSQLLAALVCGVVCAALGCFVPALIARIPEPEPEPEPEPASEPEAPAAERQLFSSELPPAPPKELYVDIAARPRLALSSSLSAGAAGIGIGAALGWTGALVYLVPLVPVAVALFVVDWRTTLLPSWIIKPAYPALVVLLLVAWGLDGDLSSLERAGWGWLVVGGWFLVFWLITGGGGWGYGDVRLSGLLGPALGYLGWSQMISGLVLIFLCGSVGAVALALRHRSMKARLPYGPYMLIGAWLGIVVGPWLASGAGY